MAFNRTHPWHQYFRHVRWVATTKLTWSQASNEIALGYSEATHMLFESPGYRLNVTKAEMGYIKLNLSITSEEN